MGTEERWDREGWNIYDGSKCGSIFGNSHPAMSALWNGRPRGFKSMSTALHPLDEFELSLLPGRYLAQSTLSLFVCIST